MIAYFDSSVLLAILLDEETKAEAYSLWTTSNIRVSSILLKIETTIVLRRTYAHFNEKLNADWLTLKTGELQEYLKEVNYRILDEDIEQSINLKKDLSRCRVLDAIHIATALEFLRIAVHDEFRLFSFDAEMLDLAKQYRIATNAKKIG